MGDYSGKRASNELGMTRRASGIVFRNSNNNDRSTQHCNRLQCSSKLEYMKGTQTVNPEKAKKSSRFPFHSTSGKASFGSSSKHSLAVHGFRQSLQDEQISISQKETVHAESSSSRQDLEDSESVSTDTSIQTLLSEPEEVESPLLSQGSRYASEASRTSRGTSTSRSQQQIRHQPVMVSPDISSNLLMRRSMSWRNTNQIARPTSPNQGLRNLSCASISDVLPSGCSSSESGRYSKTDGLERRYDGEGSSRRGGKGAIDKRKSISNHGPSLNEPSASQQVMRRTRNGPTIEDGLSPVRTRRTLSGDTRPRSRELGSNHFSSSESNLISQFPLNEFSVSEASSANPSHSFQRQLPSISRHTYGRSGSSNLNIPFRHIDHIEYANPRMSRGPMDRDRYRRFNMEGITEVLLALDRYQQMRSSQMRNYWPWRRVCYMVDSVSMISIET
ncbi:hypothetical protein QJS10_CPA02g01510 [Acorus calamus]|uniref:Uncharacterized protein n=1 Tax=Acorus calamus TaxID=4465 RepID=A0AAV9FDZ3_ACOCL|nr:hypothetical protein QJS10_CPA02g01510 [Acorus calamus]